MKKFAVILADGNRLFNDALKFAMSDKTDFYVADDVVSGVDAIRSILSRTPDIAVIGQILPDISMIQLVRELKRCAKSTRFLFILKDPSSELIKLLNELEIIGLITDRTGLDEFFKALYSVAKGEKYVSNDVLENLRAHADDTAAEDLLEKLTPREREVLFWLAQGMTNKEIAAGMILSEKTVKNHVSHVLKKLDAADRTKAAAIAWKDGLTMIPEEYFSASDS